MVKIEANFKSSNDTPMLFTAGYQIAKSSTITKVGIIPYNYAGNTKQAGPYSLNLSYM